MPQTRPTHHGRALQNPPGKTGPELRTSRWPTALLAPLTLALSACGGGSAVLVTETANPAAACADLVAKAQLSGTTLATSYVAADTRRPGGAASGSFLPGHCVVTGSINPRVGVDGKNYAIGFQLSLPDQWNGRFLFIGGGGNDGILRDTSLSSSISGGTASPLGQGFAVRAQRNLWRTRTGSQSCCCAKKKCGTSVHPGLPDMTPPSGLLLNSYRLIETSPPAKPFAAFRHVTWA